MNTVGGYVRSERAVCVIKQLVALKIEDSFAVGESFCVVVEIIEVFVVYRRAAGILRCRDVQIRHDVNDRKSPVESAEPTPEPTPTPLQFTAAPEGYFNDALFIGDSHTDGFKDYAGLNNADYLCHNGLTVWSAVEKAEFPGKQTLAQALRGKHYGKIYLMLGINELGAGTAESWAAQYKVLLDEVRELQPDAIIFLQAIFHTTQEKSDATFFKNSTIDARNAELQKLADNETVFYIDCNPVFDDSTGALTPEYSGDGVHVKAPYYVMWRDYLFQFGVVR